MQPSETARHYDHLAQFWQQNTPANYGVSQLERALAFTTHQRTALDVGCGSHGRFIDILINRGFTTDGVDISREMISLAQERSPQGNFHTGDICEWPLPKKYDLIAAWDSTFHLPLDQQEPVLRKLCDGLASDGVLIFTCGGGPAGEITGSFEGQDFGYSTLGVETFVRLIHESGCWCRHVEYDQWPEQHVYLIAQKA